MCSHQQTYQLLSQRGLILLSKVCLTAQTLLRVLSHGTSHYPYIQGGITCGAIDEPRKSSKAIDKRVIIDFRDKNVVIARFRDINEVFI